MCYIADHDPPSQEDSEWLASTCNAALSHLVNLFAFFFSKINFLLSEFLVQLTHCILQDNKVLPPHCPFPISLPNIHFQSHLNLSLSLSLSFSSYPLQDLADMGVNSLFQLISDNRQKWTQAMWTEILQCLSFIITHNAEEDLDVLFRDRDITKRSADETKGILEPRPPLTPPAPSRRNGRRNRDRSLNGSQLEFDVNAVISPVNRMPDVSDSYIFVSLRSLTSLYLRTVA